MAYDLLPIKVMEVVKIGPALRHIVQMGLQSRVLGHYRHFGDVELMVIKMMCRMRMKVMVIIITIFLTCKSL